MVSATVFAGFFVLLGTTRNTPFPAQHRAKNRVCSAPNLRRQQRKNHCCLTKADSKKNDPSGSQMRIQSIFWSDSYSALRKLLQAYAGLRPGVKNR
jgi:hypothetical protein